MRVSSTRHSSSRGLWLKRLLLCTFSLLVLLGGLPLRWGLPSAKAQPNTPQAGAYVTNGTVNAMVTTGSVTYIGGSFTQVGPVGGAMTARNNIAALDANGQLVAWNPNANGAVNTLVVDGATIYAGGAFTNIGAAGRNHIAALSTETGTASAWNPNANDTVYALALTGATLFAGGDFTNIGGSGRNRIAGLNTGSGTATAFNPNLNNTVHALAIGGATVYAGGDFTTVGGWLFGSTRNRICAFSTGGTLANWNPNSNGAVLSLAVDTGGTIVYAGGAFTTIGGQNRNRIAALNTANNTATAWNPNSNGQVTALAVNGTYVYVGGAFATIGGQARNNLACLKADGTATGWNPNMSGAVNAIAVSGNTYWAGGAFATVGGSSRQSAAKFGPVKLAWSMAAASGSEATTPVNLTIAASEANSLDMTVNYAITGGSAAGGGVDYTLANGTATITAGSTSANIPVAIMNDLTDEADETIVVTLSGPVNAELGAITVETYTIVDNDTAGVAVSPSGGSTDVVEAGAGDSYNLALTSQPTANVTINVNPDAQVTANPFSLTFTPANWNIAQTVNVAAVDDLVAEGAHTGTIAHSAGSADLYYNGLAIANAVATIADNDAASVVVTQSGGSTSVAEGGASDTYSVVLSSRPTADVSVALDTGSQLSANPASLLFTTANWNVVQTVSVSAVDDGVAEGTHSGAITHSASSTDPFYNGISIASATAQIADNDTAGVSITQTGGSTVVAEGGAGDVYTVVLRSQPTSDVTVSVSPDAQVGANPAALVFTPGNWNSPQWVTVDAVDDSLAEGAHGGIITHSASSTDGVYDGMPVATVTATVTDNDMAGVVVTQSGGSTAVSEGGATDSYTVVLASQPTSDVTVSVSPDAQVGADTATLIFTPGNWNIAQTVTMNAVNDWVAEGNHAGTITHSAASADPVYGGIAITPVNASISDNDTAGVTVSPSGGSTDVAEGGGSDFYTVVLTSQPTSDVTITLHADPSVSVDSATLLFTPGNWAAAQTVTVSAVDDALAEGPHSGTVTHTAASADPNYQGIPVAGVTANVTDNDAVGVVVTESSGSTDVAEGGATDTYTVVLSSQPVATVVITVSGDFQLSAAPANLIFTTGNWNTAQTVTVTATNDSVAEGNHTGVITHHATSVDPAYLNIPVASVTGHMTDNDAAGVLITESSGSTQVAEGGAMDTYTVVLMSQPTTDVNVTVSPDGQVSGNPSNLVFTSGSWNTPQTVTVTAVDDHVVEGAHNGAVAHAVASADPNYSGAPAATIVASIADNDTTGVSIAETGGSTDVTEGGTSDVYTVVLTSQPTANVTVTVVPDAQAGVNPGPLLFTPADWNTAQLVTVSAADDAVAEGNHAGTITHSAASADPNYDGSAVNSVTVHIADNDTASVSISQSGGNTAVAESGTNDTYNVTLGSHPTSDVTVSVTPDAQVGASPAALTFTPGNWNMGQTVTVSAVDDWVAEGNHAGTIAHAATSADPNYAGIAIAPVNANISDNDTAGVTVSPSGGSTDVAEGGVADTYNLVLTSQPLSDVNLSVTCDAQVGTAPASLTFTPGNWNVVRTVTVSAEDDRVDEGPHTGTVTHATASSDPNYQGRAVASITAAITDNDSAGVTVTQSGGSTDVAEGGADDTYSVVLDSQPTANVVINVNADSQAAAGPGSLTFTPGNWNVAQTVTVTAADDAVAEGPHNGTITHSATSTDPKYMGIAVAGVTALITDNDAAGIMVNESAGSTAVAEGGGTDTYTVVLTSQPLANVTVSVSPDAQVGVNPSGLTFTPGSWNLPQTITVSAVDDSVMEGLHTGTITHGAASADPNYDGAAIASVTANITDNDSAGVAVSESGGASNVTEGGASDTYALVLSAAPASDVVITVSPDAQVSANPGTVTFTPGNWNVAQTITVRAVDDWVAEGNHTGVLSHTVASADPLFDGIAVAAVTTHVTDNDAAGVAVLQSDGSTAITEGAASDSYTVALASEPSSDVTVNISGDSQVAANPGTLTFSATDWNTPQTVSVSAVDDWVTEGNHTGAIAHNAASADPSYQGIAIASLTAGITDNDAAGVTVTPTGGATAVTEGGATDTYGIVLNSQPVATVVIALAGDSQVSAAPANLIFTSGNWNVSQSVTVTAVDDSLVEGAHTGTVTHHATSVDPNYLNIPIASVTAQITDNDAAGISVLESGGSTDVTEGGATDAYTLVLTCQPAADVTVNLSPAASVSVNPASIVFNASNWSAPRSVTVTAVDDCAAEGTHIGLISHSAVSADPGYSDIAIPAVMANVTDNDFASVSVSESDGSTEVAEGGTTDAYTVVLTSQPAANVTVTVHPDGQIGANPTSLTFTPANWNQARAVAVWAVDDWVAEGPHTGSIAHTAASSDAGYNGIPVATVVANVTDNDAAGVTVNESGGSTGVTEGGATDTYTVVLMSQPTAAVTVGVAGDARAAAEPASLIFDAGDWNVAQSVTVSAADDRVAEGNHAGTITQSISSADANYDGYSIASVTVHIADNDTAGVLVTLSGGSSDVAEGGATDTYDVVLTSQPAADVTLTVSPDSQVIAVPASLAFTSGNWNLPQTVTVAAVDDAVAEGDHAGAVSHSAASADPGYNGIAAASGTAAISDNDTAGIAIARTGGSTELAEGGAKDFYTLAPTSQPAADVTISLTPDAQVTVSPSTLTFSAADWDTPRKVTVAAVDDDVSEGDHTGFVSHLVTSTDPMYSGLGVSGLTAHIADNDMPAIILAETGGSTQVLEGGPPDTYTLALRTKPKAAVVVAVVPESRLAAGFTTLVFNPANWNTPQTITVSAPDDGVIGDTVIKIIHHSVQSLDDSYNNLSAPSVNVRVLDNDIDPESCFYFAEGYTGPGFQEYLSVGNPNSFAVTAEVTFMFTDGSQDRRTYDIPACSRASVDVNATVGVGREVSLKVTSGTPGLVAERPMYFLYQGTWTGGHDVVGASAPSSEWYFAEGYTGAGFEEWICVLNPSDAPAHLTFRFQTESEGEVVRTGSVVGAHARSTFLVNNLLGAGFQTSLKLESDQPVVAERPMYFDYSGMGNNSWTGGHCVMGTPSLAQEYYFAEGCTRAGFEEWLTLQNPNDAAITINAVYQLGQGQGDPVTKQYKVEKGKRYTVYVPNEVGAGKDVSVKLTCSRPFLAERPMYFDYTAYGMDWPGGHCVIGSTTGASEWFFAEGYTGQDFHEWLCLQNPGTEEATVVVTYYTQEAGQLPPRTITVPAKTRLTVMVNENAGANYQLSCRLSVTHGPGIIVERPMYFSYNGWDGGHDVVGYIP